MFGATQDKFGKDQFRDFDIMREELTFGHTVFTLNVKKAVTTTRLYLVSCSPYHHDLDLYDERTDILYRGEIRT